jgi:hypothetical protein
MFECYDVRPEYIDLIFPTEVNESCSNPNSESLKTDIKYILRFLQDANIKFDSVVDVGGNCGILGYQISKRFKVPVTLLETRDEVSEYIYEVLKKESILGNTFMFHYLYGYDENSRKMVSADLAVDLDITNNITSYQQYRIDSLLNSLRKLSKKYVVVTYYPYRRFSPKYIPILNDDGSESVDSFKKSFEQFFDLILEEKIGSGAKKENQGLLLIGQIKSELV